MWMVACETPLKRPPPLWLLHHTVFDIQQSASRSHHQRALPLHPQTAALLAPVHALATQLIYKPAVEAIGVAGLFTSAGGALPPALDEFFEAVGVRLTVVYGLTETAPMLTGRVDKPKQVCGRHC